MQRILIIDDEQCVRETLGEFSKMLGYEPILVDDPSLCTTLCDGPHECTKETPCADIMLVDQYLPTMFGLDFIEKQGRKGCQIPAAAKAIITGVLSSQEQERARSLGCTILLKPVTFDDLKNWLDTGQGNL